MQTDFLHQTAGERSALVSTLCDLFDRAVAAAPEKVALRHRGRALSYREMGRAVASLARRLESILASGDVVALVLPNSIEFQIAYFAALKALTTPALVEPRLSRSRTRTIAARRHAPRHTVRTCHS